MTSESNSRIDRRRFLALGAAAGASALAVTTLENALAQEGPAEKAKDTAENAAEATKDAAKSTAKSVKKAVKSVTSETRVPRSISARLSGSSSFETASRRRLSTSFNVRKSVKVLPSPQMVNPSV